MKESIIKLNYILSKKEKEKVIGLFFMMLIGGGLEMVGVSLVLPMISLVIEKGDLHFSRVLSLAVLLVIVYILKNLFLVFMYDAIFRFTSNGSVRLSNRMLNAYLNAEYSFHLTKNVSEIARAVRYDVDATYRMLKAILQVAAEGVICLFLSVFLMYTDFGMSIFLVIVLGLVSCVFFLYSKKQNKILGKEEIDNITMTERWILQAFGGIKEVKILGKEDFFRDTIEKYRCKSAKVLRKQQLLFQIPRLLIETLSIIAIIIIVIYKMYVGNDILLLIPKLGVFAIAAFRLLPSVGKINSLEGEIFFYKEAVDSLYVELLELEKLAFSKIKTDLDGGDPLFWNKEIQVKNLKFQYNENSPEIIREGEITIPCGTAIGIIGQSGAGKTTLIDLIMGILKPSAGEILVDGNNIENNLRAWQKQIGYVPQNVYLSDDTIKANIAFGLNENEINEEKIWKALRQAQLEEFVKNMPEGLNSKVGDRGLRLSGGQRQRICIARALYHDPQLLIFDEATSALDTETEEAVMQAIEKLHGTKTMIIIAHRLTTIESCDYVYKIEKGKIILKGID